MTDKREKEVLELIKDLIKTESCSGCEEDVVSVLRDFMESHGYDEVFTDAYGNLIGKIQGKRPGPKTLFDGHMDTVPVNHPEKWKHNPFSGEIEDGKMFGRGTSDMKGALGAFTAAVAYYAEDTKKDFSGEIYVAGIVHEECFEGVAARSVSQIIRPDVVIIGEASECDLKIGQRGRAEIVVETFGKHAHSSNPEAGINAVYSMCRVVDAIQNLPVAEHPFLGKGILELTDIVSSPYPGKSVVPSYCMATYDRRLLVGETKESILKPIQEILDRLSEEYPDFSAKVSIARGKEVCYTGETIEDDRFFPAWLFDEKSAYIQDILAGLKSAGQNPKIRHYSFCTNGSHYAGEEGIQTIGLGPSRENLAHTDDEYAEVSQLLRAADCYYAVCKALNK